MTHWVENDWIEFATLALRAGGTDVARARGWSANLFCTARDAIEIAIEMADQARSLTHSAGAPHD